MNKKPHANLSIEKNPRTHTKKSWYLKTALILCTLFLFLSCDPDGDEKEEKLAKLATPQSLLLSRPDTVAEGKTAVIVSWAPVLEATGYQIQQRQGSGAWADFTPSPALTGSSTRATISRLTADTSYSFRIRALKTGRDSDYSAALSLSTLAADATALPTPSNLKASAPKEIAKQSTGVDLSWTALVADKVGGYEIQYHTKTNAWTETTVKVKSVGGKSTASLSINGLTADTRYYFRIRAVASPSDSASAPSAWSAEISLATGSLAAPSNFAIARPSANADTKIILTWDAVPNAEGYKIQQRQGSGAWGDITPSPALTGSSTQTTISGLTTGTSYSFRIRATGSTIYRDSTYSTEVQGRTLAADATALTNRPSNLKASAPKEVAKQSTGVDLSWTALADDKVGGYEIQYHTKKDAWTEATVKMKALADKGTASLSINDLKADTKFYFRIRAVAPLSDSATAPGPWSASIAMIYPANKAALQTLINSRISATTPSPDLSDIYTGKVTDMSELFKDKATFNGDISSWNTANVTNMSSMFWNARKFNQNLSAWNTGAVTDMSFMFNGATAFNGDISNWNTGAVQSMSNMFASATSFNGDISAWNTGAVQSMRSMFSGATSFNGDMSNWKTGAVESMGAMFASATSFNGDISNWNTGAVENMYAMFAGATSFNGDISNWKTGAVESMGGMFASATSFNGNISAWKTDVVTNMSSMFNGASIFNQNLSGWKTGAVTRMSYMFQNAGKFNQDLSGWNVNQVTDHDDVFNGSAMASDTGKHPTWKP